jgi:tetratricopeptide (TPR) repeat protein
MMRIIIISIILHAATIPSFSPVSAQTPEQNTSVHYLKIGSEQLKTGDYRAARESFEQSLRYDDSAFEGHLGLGVAYFRLQDDKNAERELLKAVEINPKTSTAYQYLGELYYRGDDLETAASYWEKALALDPSATTVRERLERIRKEYTAEQNFNRDVSSHFLIKYEGREKIEAGRIVSRILEDAYGEVGRALSYYPDQEIQVILYSSKQFQEVTDAPGWSGGLYDGKIRLPIGGIEQETPGLRRNLFHEYTHAVVHAITSHCPTWLNEGLAQYMEGKQTDQRQLKMLRNLVKTGNLPSLNALEGSFTGMSVSQAQLAYLISLSSVRYMIDSYGIYNVKNMLDELAKGANIGNAISKKIMMSYEDFQRRWKETLEQ